MGNRPKQNVLLDYFSYQFHHVAVSFFPIYRLICELDLQQQRLRVADHNDYELFLLLQLLVFRKYLFWHSHSC